jgi:hypothetical protein
MTTEAETGWSEVARDPSPFLALRLCSAEWLERSLPALRRAGDDDRDLDVALQALSARLGGGPLPDEVLPDRPALAATTAGRLAATIRFGDAPEGEDARRLAIRRLRIALPWAARALGLPAPDPLYARVGIESLTMGADLGRVDEPSWFERVEEVLIDAYLSTDDPRNQSGKSGDEVDWRWSRELVLDTFEGDGSLLDVGCANGYFMESIDRWARERGRVVEPYGLEISARMAALARTRLPRWADRIWVGNALDWKPPRRFDVVHTGLDYVLPDRRRRLVRHLLDHAVAPGGRVVIRAERAVAGVATPADQLQALGLVISGTAQAVHPRSGQLRVTAWISR